MKKRGFTLVELIIVLSVLSCIISTSVLSYKFIKNIEDEENVALSIRNIDDTITSARLYCIKNNIEGNILFEQATGAYEFYLDITGYAKPIRKEKLAKNVRFHSSTEHYQWHIKITKDGIPSAGTIILEDNHKKCYYISIGVGNSNEEVQ